MYPFFYGKGRRSRQSLMANNSSLNERLSQRLEETQCEAEQTIQMKDHTQKEYLNAWKSCRAGISKMYTR